MDPCAFENFDITIYGEHPPFLTTFAYRGQSADGRFDQDVNLPGWETFQHGAENGFDLSGTAITQLGSELFRALVHSDLRDLWVAAQQDLDRGVVGGLRLRLMLRPPTVAALPWELLHDPDRRRTFAADHRTPLVRVETQQRYVVPARPLAATLPLKLLLVVPTDPTGQINGAGEEKAIRQSLADIPHNRIHLATETGQMDILDLRRALEREQPDLVHIVTHGAADGLLLWQDGKPDVVSPASLRTALGWTDSVKLVVLNACRSAQDPAPAPLASLGAQILQTGIPAVVAMQYDIRDRDAVRFSQLLYTGLMNGSCAGRVDAAMGYARSGLYALNNQDISFGTPVLWLNSADGVVFEVLSAEDSRPDPFPDLHPNLRPEPDLPSPILTQAIEVETMAQWADTVTAQFDPDQFSGDLKLLAIQVEQTGQDFKIRLNQLSGLYQRRQQGNYAAASTQIRRMEAIILEKQGTLQRLADLLQSLIDAPA